MNEFSRHFLMKELDSLVDKPLESLDQLKKLIDKYSTLYKDLDGRRTELYRKLCSNFSYVSGMKFLLFQKRVYPHALKYKSKIRSRICFCPFKSKLPVETYGNFLRIITNDVQLFREKNIPLFGKEERLKGKYLSLMKKQKVMFDGKNRTIRDIQRYLLDPDAAKREKAWWLFNEKLTSIKPKLDKFLDDLIATRTEIALNSGFNNYRDYMYRYKGRILYTPEDLTGFYNTVEEVVVPVCNSIARRKSEKLGLAELNVWDIDIIIDSTDLKPYKNGADLLLKLDRVFSGIDEEFGRVFRKMRSENTLDLESRKGKLPVGFTMPLYNSNTAFICLNCSMENGKHEDITGIHHEFGHALHFSLLDDRGINEYCDFLNMPGEIMELASITVELLAMDHYDVYYSDRIQCAKAKICQYKRFFNLLSTIVMMDAFEQRIYTDGAKSSDERDDYFASILDRFFPYINWKGMEDQKRNRWLRYPHPYQLPLYFIEYAFPLLGAISIYREYKKDSRKTMAQFLDFLRTGYSKPVDETYKVAGIEFDFSRDYVKNITEFVINEIEEEKKILNRSE
ncbi:MAG: M3 family metallopeptidase [Clostridiaceae bacterium]